MILVGPLGGIMAWDPQFDPTGKKIIFVSLYGTTMETINLDGSGRTVIRKAFSFGGPSFSLDGKRIAYSCRRDGPNSDVFVRNLVTGADKRLTTNAAEDWDPTWSPDGSRIAFTSYRGTSPNGQIWTVSSTGGPQVRITKTDKDERSAVWSH